VLTGCIFPHRTGGCLGRFVVNSLESQCFCATGLFRSGHQSDRFHGFWPMLVLAFKSLMFYFVIHLTPLSTVFTDAIAGDWGGKPFDDLRHGWQHVLKNHPEVCISVDSLWSNYINNCGIDRR